MVPLFLTLLRALHSEAVLSNFNDLHVGAPSDHVGLMRSVCRRHVTLVSSWCVLRALLVRGRRPGDLRWVQPPHVPGSVRGAPALKTRRRPGARPPCGRACAGRARGSSRPGPCCCPSSPAPGGCRPAPSRAATARPPGARRASRRRKRRGTRGRSGGRGWVMSPRMVSGRNARTPSPRRGGTRRDASSSVSLSATLRPRKSTRLSPRSAWSWSSRGGELVPPPVALLEQRAEDLAQPNGASHRTSRAQR